VLNSLRSYASGKEAVDKHPIIITPSQKSRLESLIIPEALKNEIRFIKDNPLIFENEHCFLLLPEDSREEIAIRFSQKIGNWELTSRGRESHFLDRITKKSSKLVADAYDLTFWISGLKNGG